MKVKKILTKKLFGTIPVFLLIALIGAGGVSAALIEYYGVISGTATVQQSVTFATGDKTSRTFSFDGDKVSGDSISDVFSLVTKSEVPVEVGFETTYKIDSNSDGTWDSSTSSVTGIDTTYQLVTTAFAKRAASVDWSGGSVTLTVNAGSNKYDDGAAVVMVPLNKKIGDVSNWTTTLDGSTGDAYAQIMIDLDPSDPTSNWVQIVKKGDNNYNLWEYTSEFEQVDIKSGDGSKALVGLTASDVKDELASRYSDATVVAVKGNLWSDDTDMSGTVDSITFDGTAYNLDKDDRTELDVSSGFTMPPLPDEEFDIQVTNTFDPALEPGKYKITSKIVPQ